MRDNPPRVMPLNHRLREWFATAQAATGARLRDIRSEDIAHRWISQEVEAVKSEMVTFSIMPGI